MNNQTTQDKPQDNPQNHQQDNATFSFSRLSGYFLDWSRVGELLRSGTHRYTWEQLATRGAMVAAGAVGAYTGSRKDSYARQIADSKLCGGFIGFFALFIVAHTIVILPLIAKRMKASQACREYENEILKQLAILANTSSNLIPDEAKATLTKAITDAAHRVMSMDCETDKRANASLTWGTRKRFMERLARKVTTDICSLSASGTVAAPPAMIDILVQQYNNEYASQQQTANLFIVDAANHAEISSALARLFDGRAHFTNGTYALAPAMCVPTTLAGFKRVLADSPNLPLVIAVNSDTSMTALNKTDFEPQKTRALKVAAPLAQAFPSNKVVVVFYDELTPNRLYECLSQHGQTQTLHKWGYGTTPNSPKIEGAECFSTVYGFPLANDLKPVCYDDTTVEDQSGKVVVDDLRNKLISNDGVLFELPADLAQYRAPALVTAVSSVVSRVARV